MFLSQKSVWRNTCGFGLMVGISLIMASLAFYMKNQPISINQQLTSINYFLVVTGIFFSVKRYRDSHMDGVISYGRALGAGVVTLFIASLLFGLYTYIMIAYVNPGILDEFLSIVRQNFTQQGMADEDLEQVMALYKNITPGMFAYTEVLCKTFMGFIFSLIMAGFLKRNRNLLNSRSLDKFDQMKRS